MIFSDYHVHTAYCDGKSTPEEIVTSAIKKGMTHIGFSGHSYTFFDESYCMSKEATKEYISSVQELKQKYADKICVLCGIEQDCFSTEPTDAYDYVIGSVHYVKASDKYLSIDHTKDIFISIVNEFFGGDYYSLAESYFESVGNLASAQKIDIIGHFDLVTKFNEDGALFDESHPRYIAAWRSAVDKLIVHNIPFEVNTGAMSRGYRTKPYPSEDILDYIRSKGGRVILSSDSHSADTLCFSFNDTKQMLDNINITVAEKI